MARTIVLRELTGGSSRQRRGAFGAYAVAFALLTDRKLPRTFELDAGGYGPDGVRPTVVRVDELLMNACDGAMLPVRDLAAG